VSWQFSATCDLTPTMLCAPKPYLSFGSMFFATTQCTTMSSGGGYTPPRNFLSCFADTETVQIQGEDTGNSVTIGSLRIGDRVYAANSHGNITLSDVVAIPHASQDVKNPTYFLHIITREGLSLKVTPDHLLVGGDCDTSSYRNHPLPLVKAGSASRGTCLLTQTGLQVVSELTGIWGKSFHTLITMDDYVVVNGFIASPFSWSHIIGQSFYSIHRYLYNNYPRVYMLDWIARSANIFPDLLSG
jgi:hypothetical protein